SRCEGSEFNLLAGVRYVDLHEKLRIHNSSKDFLFNNVTDIDDSFSTRNQFYGIQVGGHLPRQWNRLCFDATAKMALGPTHQVVDVQGTITQSGPNPLIPPGLGTFPGGYFAQPSNIGRLAENQLTVIPSVELKVGYQIAQWLTASIGYDAMYWGGVVRP